MMTMEWQVIICISFLIAVVSCDDISQLGRPENNILTLNNQNYFSFSSLNNNGGNPKHVADEQQRLTTDNWRSYGIEVKPDSSGLAYVQVDLKKPYIVKAFAVTGFPGGSHKPTGEFYLEGSNNAQNWKMVGIGKPSQWHAPGTYPFKREQIIPSMYPNSYRYYRVIAKGFTNNLMLINNWGLFV